MIQGRKAQGAFEEVKTHGTAEEKAREGTGASGENRPLETQNKAKGRLWRS